MKRECRKDDRNWPWLCSCNDCSRAAAGAWSARMDLVFSGELDLQEARTLQEAEDKA